MTNSQCGDKTTVIDTTMTFGGGVPSLQDLSGQRLPILDMLLTEHQPPVSPGLSSREHTPSASQSDFAPIDEDERVPSTLNEDVKSSGLAKVAPIPSLGNSSVNPFSHDDDEEDEDDDDNWFSPKGPPNGVEHPKPRPPVNPIIKK